MSQKLWSTKIQDVRQASMPSIPSYAVRHDMLALIVSFCMLLNIAAMPMKAYVSENFPWNAFLTPEPDTSNYTMFNSTMLQLQQDTYNENTLPKGSTYYSDEVTNVQVARNVLNFTNHQPLSRDDCTNNLILGFPGLIYYTLNQLNHICNMAASNNATAYVLSHRGDCFYNKFSMMDIGYSCMWIEQDDKVNNITNSNLFTVVYTFSPCRFEKLLWCKFVFRVLLTAFILRQMWTNYYKHCFSLARLLRSSGHRCDLGKEVWQYEIILGDPTTIVLMDPWIAITFVFDIFLSTNNIGISGLRATQNGDLTITFITFLYLSRLVWFAYCALCLVAYVLKKYNKESYFAQVDPTIVAIATAIYCPLVSWLTGNVAPLSTLYRWMFTCLVPSHLVGQQDELLFGSIVYSSTIASLPVIYGFLNSMLGRNTLKRKVFARDATIIFPDYSSISYNNFKNRLIFGLRCRSNRYNALTVRGGTVYALFAKNPRYKSCPTFSTRAADCFVTCYYNGQPKEKLRLSLLSSLSLHSNDPTLAIKVSKIPAMHRFNELVECLDGSHGMELHQPLGNTVWCI